MINTRLLGSGAISALAIMIATAASPAAAQISPREVGGYSGSAPILPETVVTMAEAQDQRGRGGRGGGREGRSGGGSSMRSGSAGDTGRWNGAQSRANDGGGGRWNGRGETRANERASTSTPRSAGGSERGSDRSYRYSGGYAGNAGAASVPESAPSYTRSERGSRSGERGNYGVGSSYSAGASAPIANEARGGRARFGEGAAVDRGNVQDSPAYGGGNRRNAASPYAGNTEVPAPGAAVAGVQNGSTTFNQRSERGNVADGRRSGRGDGFGTWRGNDRRGDWQGDRRGDNRGNWRGNEWRDGRGNWADNNRRGDASGNWRGNDRRGNWQGDRRGNWRNDRGGRQFAYGQGFRDGARWDRGWRNNNRFNWIGHRQANRFLFRPGPYFSPFAGHFYRPVGIGFFLDPLFFQPRFFLNDPWAFRLPPAGDRFRWVRYYEDVLLVDVFTGEVVDVIENFFW
jgi:hypothetical protein